MAIIYGNPLKLLFKKTIVTFNLSVIVRSFQKLNFHYQKHF